MDNKENEIFSTGDLYLSATLITIGFNYTDIDYVIDGEKNYPIVYFKFKNTPEIKEAKKRYNQGNILVEPKIFVTNMKSLKAEISNIQKNPHFNR